ncbi:MAG TPA: TIR domain-containing protein, partial [Allocoleopsis sp.]
KEHIIKQLLDGGVNENEEFTLMTSSQPQTCPYNPANLIDTKYAEYEIEIIKDSLPNRANEVTQNEPPISEITVDYPTVFISYSWDDEPHKDWILNLTKRLFDKGINVLLDRMELRPGKNMIYFMESSISKSNKVLIVFTPNYKLKAEKRQGGVGFEYSILNAELYNQITTNEKFIPILKSGSFSQSIPSFMQQFIGVDMTKSEAFEEKLNELVYAIYDKPQIEKPKIGANPFISQPQISATEQTNDLLKEVEKETNILTKEAIELEANEKEMLQEIKEPKSSIKPSNEYLSKLKARLEKQIQYKEKFETIYDNQTYFLEKLEYRLEGQQDFLEKLNTQLDDLEDKYASAWDSNLKDKISQWIEEKKIKITEVEEDIHNLQDKIEDVKENVYELPDRIKSIETSITTLEIKINAAKNK